MTIFQNYASNRLRTEGGYLAKMSLADIGVIMDTYEIKDKRTFLSRFSYLDEQFVKRENKEVEKIAKRNLKSQSSFTR